MYKYLKHHFKILLISMNFKIMMNMELFNLKKVMNQKILHIVVIK